jgi:guanine deaminase
MARTAIRARLLDFTADPAFSASAVRLIDDGLLLIEDGRIVARGEYAAMSRALSASQPVADFSDCLLLPGFIDTHTHFAQVDVIASPAPGVLDWLAEHTYPAETAFSNAEVCRDAAAFFVNELVRNGTTSACVLGTVHAQSVEAIFREARSHGMRLIAGKCLMDRNCPEGLRDSPDRGVRDSIDLAARWHGQDRLGYAITPRFAGTSSAKQLSVVGELARARPDLHVQTHVAESEAEVRWVRELYPQARSYLDIYDSVGLLRELSIFAHCVWLDAADRRRFARARALAAVCPTSNAFLGSGDFDFKLALEAGMQLSLGTDIGGGQSFSMLATMRAAYEAARSRGVALRAAQLFHWATRGAANALGWHGKVGTLEPGAEADFVVLDPEATPLLARRAARADSIEALLFALLVLGDDRAVRETFIAGQASKNSPERLIRTPVPHTGESRTLDISRRFMGRMQGAPKRGKS